MREESREVDMEGKEDGEWERRGGEGKQKEGKVERRLEDERDDGERRK